MGKRIKRYGDLFDTIHTPKARGYESLLEECDKPTERYGMLLEKSEEQCLKKYGMLFQNVENPNRVSVYEIINLLDTSKTKIKELEAQGTSHEKQLAENIRSEFAGLVDKMLTDKFFAIFKPVLSSNGKLGAFIFDSSDERDYFVANTQHSEMEPIDFHDFKKRVGLDRNNIDNYCYSDNKLLIFRA